ncbi:type II toxin-antitoxin system HicB family antitoxin [Billgrantia bachuensis]|uniref:Type II toxin-antitoxin system HicB family antitoxin n=1 Tax=Billgrantia bachuensis TaxID=2717286 RepID=A0ABX0PRR3_9GAMM|nr:type II toxin-antitoxin system HicB family antitoxin [Halomonas bachuensis]NIC05230.1 type II toxin-antitoxin system HicB family antitoxin [Halomonas bachuensis]
MKPKVLEYRGYQGSIEVSPEDNVLHGKILHIVDLVTFEAQTPAGLRQAFEHEVEEYLAFCEEEGVAPDKPFSGTFNVRLGSELHRQLALAASREGLGINETLKKIVEIWLHDCPDGFRVVHHHNHMHEHFYPAEMTHDSFRGGMNISLTEHPRPELRVVQ